MEKVKVFLGGIFLIVAAIPGIGKLTTGLYIPPNNNLLFSFVIDLLPTITIARLMMKVPSVRNLTEKQVSNRIWSGLTILLISVVCLIYLYPLCVINIPTEIAKAYGTSEQILFPLFPSKELSDMLGGVSPNVFIEQNNPVNLKKVLTLTNSSLFTTELILVVLYSSTLTSLSFIFGIIAIRAVNKKRNTRKP